MAPNPRPLVAGNWKMNGSLGECKVLLDRVTSMAAEAGGVSADVVVCPPTPYLTVAAASLTGSPIGLGAQDCHVAASGAHTGDVSAEMLSDIGCAFVIVGHSERRTDHGERDALICSKAEAAHRAGLVAIVCIGETDAERNAGETLAVVGRQLRGSVPSGALPGNTVVAYEPVWAIGTGRTPTAAEVGDVHSHLRALLAQRFGDAGAEFRLLYGGSVKPDNAVVIMAIENVDGGLIGGASLKAETFWPIAKACG